MRNLLEPEHLLVILLVVVVLFGGKGIPEMGAALGRGVRDFRHALDGGDTEGPTAGPPTPPAEVARRASEGDEARAPRRLLP